MALVSALRAARRPQGYRFVALGVIAGMLASLAAAFILHAFFPAVTSGASREAIEGFVGVLAVFMIVIVGLWLHSKSSQRAWREYIQSHMNAALTTGSFVSLFGLSFLSFFREGAETILFYVGILPNIALTDFVMGVVWASVILLVVAWLILKTSVRLPVPSLFKVLIWVLYALGFKILGVSIHALQLTHYLKTTPLPGVPAFDMAGFFPTLETVLAQGAYLAIIVLISLILQRPHH